MLFQTLLLVTVASLLVLSPARVHAAPAQVVVRTLPDSDYIGYTQSVMNDLHKKYFDPNEGLWDSAWWESGEVLNMIANMAYWRPGSLTELDGMPLIDIFNSVLDNAPRSPVGAPDFIGQFFDDDLWYGNAWITVYRWASANSDPNVSGQAQNFLNMAQTIVNNAQQWVDQYKNINGGQKNCYGLQWSKQDPNGGINAIENSLYFKATAQLAWIRSNDPRATFIDSSIDYSVEATNMKNFFLNSSLITSNYLVADGIDMETCQAIPGAATWTYNTGVLMGALSHFTLATNDDGAGSSLADSLAHGGMAAFQNATAPGILFETACRNSPCGTDAQQFKGIFAANIMDLFLTTSHHDEYREWLQNNAETVYTRDRSIDNQLGFIWSGPPDAASTMEDDSSGLEALVGAACVTD